MAARALEKVCNHRVEGNGAEHRRDIQKARSDGDADMRLRSAVNRRMRKIHRCFSAAYDENALAIEYVWRFVVLAVQNVTRKCVASRHIGHVGLVVHSRRINDSVKHSE